MTVPDRDRRRFEWSWIVIGACVAITVYIAVVPLGFLVWQSFFTPQQAEKAAQFTFGNYVEAYGSPETAQMYLYMGYAFRAFNTHGRAMFTLAHRAMAGQNEDDYVLTDGERICSTAIGWNFGDGHMHNEQLIAAMQQRCHFEPGEVRVVLLDVVRSRTD